MPANKPPFDGEWVKLGELISKAPIERCGDAKYPVYSMTMRDGIVEQAGRFKKAIASKDTSSYKVVKKNQLVVGFPIDEGVIYVQNHDAPGIMSPAYNVWNIDLGRVDPSYLEFALHGPRSMAYYADKMRGTTARRRTLTADGLREMEILLPSADGQIRVVNTLDEVRSLIEGASGQIAMLDTLVKSRFVEMFGDGQWKRTALSEVADIQGGLTKSGKRDLLPLKLPYLRVANVLRGTLYLDEVLEIGLTAAECEKNLLVEGDLLFVEGNGSADQIGRCAVWDGSIAPCVHQNHLIRVRFDERVLPVYALAYFNAHDGREQIVARAVNTSGLFTLSTGKVKALQMPLPPLPLQQKFADFVNNVDKSRYIVQRKIEKLQTLYDSLAQEYFG